MKSIVTALVCSVALVAFSITVFAQEKGKQVTLKGDLLCAKCSLGQTAGCTTAIQVQEGDKTVTYLLDDKGAGNRTMSRSAAAAKRKGPSPARWNRRTARTISSRPRSNTPRNKNSRRQDCVGFDLDEYLRRDEPADFDHAGCRPNVSEELAVRLADLFPAGDVGHEHARPHNVAQ